MHLRLREIAPSVVLGVCYSALGPDPCAVAQATFEDSKTTAMSPRLFSTTFPSATLLFTAFLFTVALSPSSIAADEIAPRQTLEIFVDSEHGDDANRGAKDSEPLRTLHAAQGLIDEAPEGHKIILRLARGSVWRESLSHPPVDHPEGEEFIPRALGREGLTVTDYGKGEKPTLSGYDLLSNEAFARQDPEKYPNVWSQTVTPPPTYYRTTRGGDGVGFHRGILVGGLEKNLALAQVWTPLEESERMRDQPATVGNIKTEADALDFVNSHPGTFYVRDNGDKTFTYFLNSGSDPTSDGLTYEYKVRGTYFRPTKGNTWENIRIVGNADRSVAGHYVVFRGVELINSHTHTILIAEGRYEDVLIQGSRPHLEVEGANLPWFGSTYSGFHTHSADSRNLLYDRCTVRNVGVAFFDHHRRANREAVVIRDCITENVGAFFGHGDSTKKSFVIGHRHDGGGIGGMAMENFLEDSIFRNTSRWHGGGLYQRIRNCVVHAKFDFEDVPRRPPVGPFTVMKEVDYVYENATLVFDLEGIESTGEVAPLAAGAWEARKFSDEGEPGNILLKNCVVAIVNAPKDTKTSADADGIAIRFQESEDSVKVRFENCVLTFMEAIPESAGKEGEDFVFADVDEIFAGDPAVGDFTLKAGGLADKKDVGYREGREPVYRPLAEEIITNLPY